MSKKIDIAVFTSSRSDFFPAKPLLEKLKTHDKFNLRLLVGGGHLIKSQGNTLKDIEEAGFTPHHLFPFLKEDINSESLSNLSARFYQQITDYFSSNKPNGIFLLGDRFELLPVATVAFLEKISIAHISGGDVTKGAIDNQVRNAVSMLSHWHFPGSPESRDRLISMGINRQNICLCGELGIEAILNTPRITKNEFCVKLGLIPKLNIIACSFHPETIGSKITPQLIIDTVPILIKEFNAQLVFTSANIDEGGEKINKILKEIANKEPKVFYFENLGALYYSLMEHSIMLLGNSSSAIIESQSFNTPSVNIGDRQKGRTLNPNTLNSEADPVSILNTCLIATNPLFKSKYYDKPNHYGNGNTSSKIIDFLENFAFK